MPSDMQLQRDIEAELEREFSINARKMRVSVKNGSVSLTGSVQATDRIGAEIGVKRRSGVKAVRNDIAALRRAAEVDARSASVTAKRRAITLEGETQSWRERSEVERAAWSAPGVWSGDNRIVVANWPERAP